MKLTAMLLIFCFLQVSAKSYSQARVTLSVNNMALDKVFSEIKKQTGYDFFYNSTMIEVTNKVSFTVSNVSIEVALKECLKGQPLTFKIVDETVSIRKIEDKNPIVANIIPPGTLITVHGKVVDSLGNPLAGASITVKGLNKGTSTDSKGDFELQNIYDNATLKISFTGFQDKEFHLTGNNSLIFYLIRSNNRLDQVEVIAYGTTTQRLSAGDISTIGSKEIEQEPISNPLSALEGRVPGMFIIQNTGVPGGGFNVQIQGKNSISNSSDPFYVIDGVPYPSELLPNQGFGIYQSNGSGSSGSGNPLSFINPSDIESISVLKDADATAIYGSQAANGAILITTKKGKPGTTKLDINLYSGIGRAPLNVKWLNTPEYLKMRRQAFYNDSIASPSTYSPPDQYSAPDLMVWDTSKYTNWQKTLIGSASHYNDVQISISGGNTNTQFLIGGGYHSETTVFPIDGGDKKLSFHTNISNTSSNQKFKISFSSNFLFDNRTLPSYDFTSYISTPPDAPPPFNVDGSLNFANSSWPGGNPYSITKFIYQSKVNNLISNAVISYNLLKGLQILSSFGYNYLQATENSTIPIIAQDPAYSPTGTSYFTNNNIQTWIIEPQLAYHVNKNSFKIETLIGSTIQQNTANGQILNATGYISDLLLNDPQAAPNLSINSQTNSIYRYNAFFGRLNLNYLDKYIANFNWRRDGSSRFGPDNQFHNFASLAFAWIFSNEEYFKNLSSYLSFGKIRASYGTTGNDQIGDYGFYDLFNTTQYSYQGTIGLTPYSLYNPNIAWELTKKLQGGIDLGFFKDRILLNTSYYYNLSSNQLINYSLPSLTGFRYVPANLAATVENKGLEITLNASIIKTRDFTWTISTNLTSPQNKLKAFPNIENTGYKNTLIIGQPLGIIKVFHQIGVNDTTGVYEFASNKGTPTYNPISGIDNNVIISTAPKLYGGFSNSFNFKGFQLDILFQFTKQVGPNILLQLSSPPGNLYASNEPQAVLNNWKSSGDKSSIAQFSQDFNSNATNGYYNAQTSDLAYTDASYIRLKNLSLSYHIPLNIINKIHFQNCMIYIQGQNLLTITKYKGLDPETQSISILPPLKVLTAGIRCSL